MTSALQCCRGCINSDAAADERQSVPTTEGEIFRIGQACLQVVDDFITSLKPNMQSLMHAGSMRYPHTRVGTFTRSGAGVKLELVKSQVWGTHAQVVAESRRRPQGGLFMYNEI